MHGWHVRQMRIGLVDTCDKKMVDISLSGCGDKLTTLFFTTP